MKQKKLERIRMAFLLLCIIVSLLIIPVRADEAYQVIVTLQAPEPTSSGGFGTETKLFEEGILVGSFKADVDGIASEGQAYFYDSDWNLITTFQSPTPGRDGFGRQVDAYGDKLVISNVWEMVDDIHSAGKVYLFDTDSSLILELKAPIAGARLFGTEVALGKDIILVSEIGAIVEGFSHAGIVQVYDYEGGYIRNLTSPSMKQEGGFGGSIAAGDEYVLVGETGARALQIPEICSVYVFDYDWNHVATLNAPDKEERTCFGISTSISSDYVVVGEPWATVEGHENAGRAHIYDTDWNHVTTLKSPTPEALAEFGCDVAMGGDIVVVGERKGDVDTINEGKVHVFDLEGNLIATLVSPEPAVSALFGHSVETDGEIIVVGETGVEAGGESKAGKVHVFGLGEPAAEQPAPEEEATETESELESETEKSGGIPGFPFESIVLSIALAVLALWLIQRQH